MDINQLCEFHTYLKLHLDEIEEFAQKEANRHCNGDYDSTEIDIVTVHATRAVLNFLETQILLQALNNLGEIVIENARSKMWIRRIRSEEIILLEEESVDKSRLGNNTKMRRLIEASQWVEAREARGFTWKDFLKSIFG